MALLTEQNQYLYSGLWQFSLIGTSHKEMDADHRELYSLSSANVDHMFQALKELKAENVLILSTCNRTEVYCKTNQALAVKQAFFKEVKGTAKEFEEHSYQKTGLDAVKHLFEVGAGLHSQILGDFEIIGQIRKAFRLSKEKEASGTFLERMVNTATQMSKRIKNQTSFSSGVTSTAFAAVDNVRRHFSDFKDKKVTIYGMGKIGGNVCQNLVKHFPPENIRIINRSLEKALELSKKYNLDLFGEDMLSSSIEKSDAVIVATGADSPTVTKEMIPSDRELLLIDLSMPRNISHEIDKMTNCTVLGVDEISKINEETFRQRRSEIDAVESILEDEMSKFREWMESRKHASAIQAIKANFKDFQRRELLKAKKNPEDEKVQDELEISNKVINRITGHIFSKLKDLEESELEAVYKLFNLTKEDLNG